MASRVDDDYGERSSKRADDYPARGDSSRRRSDSRDRGGRSRGREVDSGDYPRRQSDSRDRGGRSRGREADSGGYSRKRSDSRDRGGRSRGREADSGDYPRKRSDYPDDGGRSRGREADTGDYSQRRSGYQGDERSRRRDDAGDYPRRERSPRRQEYRNDTGRSRGRSRYDGDRGRRSSYDDADARDADRRRRRDSSTKWEDDAPKQQTLANEKLPDWLADLGGGPDPPDPGTSSSGGPPARLTCKTIQIPSQLKWAVIGTGGAIINKIRAETQSYIQLNSVGPQDPYVSCMITGNVEKAEAMIMEKVNEAKQHESWKKKGKKDEWKTEPKNSWLMQQLQKEGCSGDRAGFLLQSAAATEAVAPTLVGLPALAGLPAIPGMPMASINNNWIGQWHGK